jgi:serine kinase of HPr protein (carbohydrate metabolism regulator)
VNPPPVHATVVARYAPDGWQGVLLRGPSGAGKSDLALRLIDRGWRLIGDDYVLLWRSGDSLHARGVAPISGRIEARGLGILRTPTRDSARIVGVFDCVQRSVERLPEPAFETLHGVELPVLTLDTRPASAAQVLALAIGRL